MENIVIIMITGLLLALAALSVFFYRWRRGKIRTFEAYQSRRKRTLVSNGVDVRKQAPCSGKGEYFTGNLVECDTSYVNSPAYGVWRISFQDMDSAELYRFRFRRRIWIGRKPDAGNGDVCLALVKHEKISKIHCVIYEGEGTLYVADQNSKNHTFLNGQRVDTPAALTGGDRFSWITKERCVRQMSWNSWRPKGPIMPR